MDSQAWTSGNCDLESGAPEVVARAKQSPGAPPECDSILSGIRDLASEFGVSARALRFYEERGLLNPRRDGTGRYYGPRDRLRLKMILHGEQLGFSLSEICDILDGEKNASGRNHPAGAGAKTAQPGRAGLDDSELDAGSELRLPGEQIAAQINHLERQRKDIDDAILFLRNAGRRLDEAGPPAGPS